MGVKGILKWPLIIAAIVVLARVVTEQAGATLVASSNLDWLNNLLSVVALHLLIVPLYLAVRIARSGVMTPYRTLFKLIAIYVVLVRAMLIPVYWLARIYEWPQPRFYGLWGPDVNAFVGFIGVPFVTAAVWIISSLIFGGLLGSLVIAVLRRSTRKQHSQQHGQF